MSKINNNSKIESNSKIDLFAYDSQIRKEGFPLFCGVDEAGRGPLAGPVVAAAVLFPEGICLPGINDSKKLSEKKREALFAPIKAQALAFGIGSADEREIEEMNILNASFLAMQRALEELVGKLGYPPQLVLVDGNRDPKLGLPTRTLVKGDGLSASIAAASILAKVTRDRRMVELDECYPQYHFRQHKGYPTKDHYAQIAAYGICPIHRQNFLKKLAGRV